MVTSRFSDCRYVFAIIPLAGLFTLALAVEPERAKHNLDAPGGFGARRLDQRTMLLLKNGGTLASERAVNRGLRFLSKHQAADGRWSLDEFARVAKCECTGHGKTKSDVGATALALLPFLGAGNTHKPGNDDLQSYGKEIDRGLRFLLANQRKDGALGFDTDGMERMYAHALATRTLCEAYALTGDDPLKKPIERALDFIIKAQTAEGGCAATAPTSSSAASTRSRGKPSLSATTRFSSS